MIGFVDKLYEKNLEKYRLINCICVIGKKIVILERNFINGMNVEEFLSTVLIFMRILKINMGEIFCDCVFCRGVFSYYLFFKVYE